MNPDFISKKIFTSRLFSFLYHLSETQMGFKPDVLQLLQTYQLPDYTWILGFQMDHCRQNPPGNRLYVHLSICTKLFNESSRLEHDPDFFRFNAVFCTYNPIFIWQCTNSFSEIQNLKFTFKLIASKPLQTPIVCVLCGHFITDVFSHATISCPALTTQHSNWWNSLSRSFTIHLETELSGIPEDDLFLILLGYGVPMGPLRPSHFRLWGEDARVRSCEGESAKVRGRSAKMRY